MTPAELYNYFSPIEAAVAEAFTAAELTCWTPLGNPVFQRERPRVEAVLMPGPGLGFFLPEAGMRVASGFCRDKARRANLNLHLVTAAEIQIHRAYVAQVLYLVDTLGAALNQSALMVYHRIGRLHCQGGSMSYQSEEGAFESSLTCELDISILETAWADLET